MLVMELSQLEKERQQQKSSFLHFLEQDSKLPKPVVRKLFNQKNNDYKN